MKFKIFNGVVIAMEEMQSRMEKWAADKHVTDKMLTIAGNQIIIVFTYEELSSTVINAPKKTVPKKK